ncbi:MAG TPA: HDOD domain-containing protein [Bryobacteraceae bacterium]|nr:HDOD domain-containing protein [Bryobacteraceae bacterium]
MDVFVARQPIFNRSRELFGYELLFRSDDLINEFDGTAAESATTQVIANSLLSIGLENIIGGNKAFINFNDRLLRAGLHSMLPRDQVVLELLETVEPDEDLAVLCRALRNEGYTIALDDFTGDPRFEPLTQIAQMIKVDIQATSEPEQERILRTYRPRGLSIVAERVETIEDFERAHRAGYDHFQGFFFARPALMKGRQIPAAKFNCLRLLREMQSPELDFGHLQAIISQDLSFSYKLLRYVNSALFSPRTQIESIGQSLMMLGEEGVRHWVALAALPELAKDKPGELVTHSLVRAGFCERLAHLAGIQPENQGFLMGLFSLLDALIDVPLDEALRQVGVGPTISSALLGGAPEQDLLWDVFRLACCYETCDWNTVAAEASKLKIDSSGLARAYSDSTFWAQRALHATTRAGNSRRESRHPIDGSLRIRWQDEEGRERMCNAQLENVSRSGLRLHVPDRIPVRALVSCNDPRVGISGSGSVRYCNASRGKYVIGLEFTNGTGWPKHAPLN